MASDVADYCRTCIDLTTPKDSCWKTVLPWLFLTTCYYVMTTVTATSIAEKLMDLFNCHGVPREILSDKGTNFMLEILQKLYKLLGIKFIRSSPYHS